MPRSDYIRRAKPRVEVLRGWDPNEPTTFTQTARASETILSGQVIHLAWDAGDGVYEWVKGGAANKVPYIAVQDDQDEDVLECGKMTGLSCAGHFEIETAYFDDESFVVDSPLGWAAGTAGNVCIATAGEDILGWVTRNHGRKSLDKINSNVPSGSEVISFATRWQAVDALP
jgi:hypothetical protein